MGIVQGELVATVQPDRLARVIAEITEQRWLALARALIVAGQPAAENPLDPDMPPGREEGISEVVAAKLAELGLAVELVSKRAGRPNVIASLAGAAGRADAHPQRSPRYLPAGRSGPLDQDRR